MNNVASKLMRVAASLATAFSLSSCGGGGSGSASPVTAGPVSLALDKSSVALAGYEGDQISGQVVNATLSPASANVYAGIHIGRTDLVDVNVSILSNTVALIGVTVKPTAPAGTYNDTITVLACQDSNCSAILASASFTYTLNLKAGIKVSPAELVFKTSMLSQTYPQPQTIRVTLPPEPGFTYVSAQGTLTAGSAYPSISYYATTAAVPGLDNALDVTISIYTVGMPMGVYQGQISFPFTPRGSFGAATFRSVPIRLLVGS